MPTPQRSHGGNSHPTTGSWVDWWASCIGALPHGTFTLPPHLCQVLPALTGTYTSSWTANWIGQQEDNLFYTHTCTCIFTLQTLVQHAAWWHFLWSEAYMLHFLHLPLKLAQLSLAWIAFSFHFNNMILKKTKQNKTETTFQIRWFWKVTWGNTLWGFRLKNTLGTGPLEIFQIGI